MCVGAHNQTRSCRGPKAGLSKAWGVWAGQRARKPEVITLASLGSLYLISTPFCSSAEEEEPPGRRVQRKYGRVHGSPWRDGRGLAEVLLLLSRPSQAFPGWSRATCW